jgi:hypothetical protein
VSGRVGCELAHFPLSRLGRRFEGVRCKPAPKVVQPSAQLTKRRVLWGCAMRQTTNKRLARHSSWEVGLSHTAVIGQDLGRTLMNKKDLYRSIRLESSKARREKAGRRYAVCGSPVCREPVRASR